jgi:hypothetical protein
MAELDVEPRHRGHRQSDRDDLSRPLLDHPDRPPAGGRRQRGLEGKNFGGKILETNQSVLKKIFFFYFSY